MSWEWSGGRLEDEEGQSVLEAIDGDVCANGSDYERLIAAAPDLLEACTLTIEQITADGSIADDQLEEWALQLVNMLRAVIARATQD